MGGWDLFLKLMIFINIYVIWYKIIYIILEINYIYIYLKEKLVDKFKRIYIYWFGNIINIYCF